LRKKRNNKKIISAVVVLLIVVLIPTYYFTRPLPLSTGVLLEVKGNVYIPQNFTLQNLQNFPFYTISVNLTSLSKPQENGFFNYEGVQLYYILKQVKPFLNCTSITLTASEGSTITISIDEVMQTSSVLAFGKDDKFLTPLKNGGDGPLRLILADDKNDQRWLKGVVTITAN
jgi:DMSO/TMAO reductase YedYZ molybdopterin-dependent catalytic subunit